MKSRTLFLSTVNFAFNQYLKEIIIGISKTDNVYLVSNFKHSNHESFPDIKEKHIEFKRSANILFFLINYLKLGWYIRDIKPHVVYTISPIAGLLYSLIPLNNSIHVHFFTGQVWYNKKGLKRILLRSFDRLIGRSCSYGLIDSPSQKEFLIKNSIISEAKSIVLGSGSIRGNKVYSFQSIKKAKKKKQILFVGRINFEKGVGMIRDFILKNKAILEESNYNIIFAGAVEDQKCINGLENLSFIQFLGHVDDINQYYAESNILILPSEREGFGSVVVEAGIFFVPAVLTNIVGLIDAGSRASSLFVEPNNYIEFEQALLKLIKNPKLIDAMGQNAHKHSMKFYTDHCTERYLKFHQNLTRI